MHERSKFVLPSTTSSSSLSMAHQDSESSPSRATQNSNLESLVNAGDGNGGVSSDTTTTVLVVEFQIRLKYTPGEYYTCLNFGGKVDSLLGERREFKFKHQGNSAAFIHIITTKDLLPIYLVVIFYLVLMFFSALFSGLNLGSQSILLLRTMQSFDKSEYSLLITIIYFKKD